MQENGYMDSVLSTLKEGEYRQFPLANENVQSWRTVASRANSKAGFLKYSIIVNSKLGFMAVKCNAHG